MKKPANALTIQGLADCLNTSRTKVSRVVNTLIKKGIFAKAVSGDTRDINQAKDYVLFINPNIIYVGDKNDVKEHLVLMFKKQMKDNPTLKKSPQKLF
ncbi:helix-turn-helix domain-containing protein [Bacillus cereus]|uniref:helix-turn-helix domain-containing protein n=1 Tax=Bacillus cereus TaxID=1396 RepID=UPI00197AED48|nr:helix-turn-helix domain-containing protein [Bacillus cereus]